MKAILVSLVILASCGGEEPPTLVAAELSPWVTPERIKCMSMRTLWQATCFCTDIYCESRTYPCFWDLSVDGLAKNPEMEDLYKVFRAELVECRETAAKLDDIEPCEDKALERALTRCERRLLGLDPFGG